MVMGCYGIGVGRAMASVIEFSHDEYGPIWPMSIAPYQVHVCVLDSNKPGIPEAAENLVAVVVLILTIILFAALKFSLSW